MASNTNNWGKHAKKAAKKTHKGILAIGLLFLLIGAAAGYLGAAYLCQNDQFQVKGEKELYVAQGTPCTYVELGASVISLGRDLSDQVKIQTDLPQDSEGNYTVDTSAPTTYVITYTVDDIRFGNIKRIRTIQVTGGK